MIRARHVGEGAADDRRATHADRRRAVRPDRRRRREPRRRSRELVATASARGARAGGLPRVLELLRRPVRRVARRARPGHRRAVRRRRSSRIAASHDVAHRRRPASSGRATSGACATPSSPSTAPGVLARYRKLHLYDAFGQRESDWVEPGELAEPETFELDGLRFGLMTCYDLRFPEVGRLLADAGADVFVVPAEWVRGPLKEHHWRTLLHARAIENTVFVAAADHPPPLGVGPLDDRRSAGRRARLRRHGDRRRRRAPRSRRGRARAAGQPVAAAAPAARRAARTERPASAARRRAGMPPPRARRRACTPRTARGSRTRLAAPGVTNAVSGMATTPARWGSSRQNAAASVAPRGAASATVKYEPDGVDTSNPAARRPAPSRSRLRAQRLGDPAEERVGQPQPGRDRGLERRAVDVGEELLDGEHRVDEVGGAGHPADLPARGREGLAARRDRERALPRARAASRSARAARRRRGARTPRR